MTVVRVGINWVTVSTVAVVFCFTGCAPNCSQTGAGDPWSVAMASIARYKRLCAQERFFEALVEYQYASGNLHVYYKKEREKGEKILPKAPPKEPLFDRLSDPENVESLVELVEWSGAFPLMAKDLRVRFAVLFPVPAEMPAKEMVKYYETNRDRLVWDSGIRRWRLADQEDSSAEE